MPLKEIYSRFRKSELIVMGWRSAEMASNMAAKAKQSRQGAGKGRYVDRSDVPDVEIDALERRMGGLANKAETASGDIDLGLLTGPEALRYMSALGLSATGRS